MKKLVAVVVLGAGLVAGVAFAKDPARNVSAVKHPNIAAAQKHIDAAFEKLEAAQKANEYDMEGHAQKAKDLLKQASDECKLAAEAANENKK